MSDSVEIRKLVLDVMTDDIRTFHPFPSVTGTHIRNFTAAKIIAVKIIFKIPKKIYAKTI